MKVVKWIDYEQADEHEEAVGGLGGWVKGNNWKEYLERMPTYFHEYAEAIRKEVIEKKIRYNGADHQSAEDGVPLFEDGKVGLFSYRAWGDLMAAIWNTEEKTDQYSYMNFYC